jgi:hypothetical protein
MPEKALMTVQSQDGPPTLAAAARQLGVDLEAVDATYGVVLIDPKRGLYSVQVDAAQLPPENAPDEHYRGHSRIRASSPSALRKAVRRTSRAKRHVDTLHT